MLRIRRVAAVLCLAATVLTTAAGSAHKAHHGSKQGHLPGSSKNVELVGHVTLASVPSGIGDVTGLGTTAYLAAWAPECFSPTGQGGGVHIVDVSIPQLPQKIGFISAGKNTYVGEGLHALHIRTKFFDGDVLMMSTEGCGRNYKGGISLYDVTDPLNPKALAVGKGDRSPKPGAGASAHSTHSAQMWTTGKHAYAVLVDNEEGGYRDVDIMDITNPRKPKLISESGRPDWIGINKHNPPELGNFGASFHHDMWVKKIGGHWMMLVSYWDSGWVLLNVDDPRHPRFVRDSDYPMKDTTYKGRRPEGNAHQGTWSGDNRYIIGTNEDLFAKFTATFVGAGESRRFIPSAELWWAPRISKVYGQLNGPTVYGGIGCSIFAIPPASDLHAKPWLQPTVVLQDGVCTYEEKLQAAQRAGYKAAIIAAGHDQSTYGTDLAAQNLFDCTKRTGSFTPAIPALCIGHTDMHRMFRSAPNYVAPIVAEPSVGTRGQPVGVFTFEDGNWGDMRLLNARTFKQIDSFAIREALDRRYDESFGPLSVHEVKVDPRPSVDLGYVSWYAGGLRVMHYGPKGLKEVGHYIDADGSNFWGTFPLAQGGDPPLLLMSDMDDGLWILRYTGAQ